MSPEELLLTGLVTGEYDDACNFLEAHCRLPSGGHSRALLVGILPDPLTQPAERPLISQWVDPTDRAQVIAFIGQHDQKRNLYFHVNPVKDSVKTKAHGTDVTMVTHLHVDLDPRPGEDLAREQQRIAQILQTPPNSIPSPTAVVFSGGGYQAFWRLAEPVPIDGDLAAVSLMARYNKRLCLMLGAVDSCFSIDHLMRLPGTHNVPDTKKRAAGRTLVKAATLPTFTDHAGFSLDAFQPVPETDKVRLVDNIVTSALAFKSLESLDDLMRWKVPERTRTIIEHGLMEGEPEKARKYKSRSEWVFEVACTLVRHNVPDEYIGGIFMDPRWKISESILEKGARAEGYALRQINSGHDHSVDEDLEIMNAQFFVIREPRAEIGREPDDADDNPSLVSMEIFQKQYMSRYKYFGEKKVPIAKWWLAHEKRREYRSVVFAPGEETVGDYNTWRGFAVRPDPNASCQLYLEHVKDNICAGNEQYYTYLIQWMAMAIQKPSKPAYSAIVLRGQEGTGKSIFAEHFGALFGKYHMSLSDPGQLTGQFSGSLVGKISIFADEAVFAGDRAAGGRLKALVTQDEISVRPMYEEAKMVTNCMHIMMASNSHWVVEAGPDARRYFVLDVSPKRKQDSEYFTRIEKQMAEENGRAALLHFLKHVDVSTFDKFKIPKTQALAEQRVLSMPRERAYILDLLDEGRLPNQALWDRRCFISKEELYADFCRKHSHKFNAKNLFFKELHALLDVKDARKRTRVPATDAAGKMCFVEMNNVACVVFPPLTACRNKWNATYPEKVWDVPTSTPQPEDMEPDDEPESAAPF